MGDCSEAGRSGRMCLTPAPVCGHCSSRCGSHGPEMMPCGARRVPPSSLTFCLARAQVLLLYAALSLAEDCHAQERVPRAYPSRNPDLTLACAASRAHDECAHFCSWTGWATQKASIPSFLSCPISGSGLLRQGSLEYTCCNITTASKCTNSPASGPEGRLGEAFLRHGPTRYKISAGEADLAKNAKFLSSKAPQSTKASLLILTTLHAWA